MKLTIKSIIRWEQLNKKPFSSLNYKDEDDVNSLLYVCSPMTCTLDEFLDSLEVESAKTMVHEFEKTTEILSQFKIKEEKKQDTESELAPSKPIYIKDVISTLVLSGLDVNYALYEMELCDIPIFIDALENKTKEHLESERLWTYLSVLPHLAKRPKSPRDLYAFPWETEQIKADAVKNIKQNKELLDKFLKGEIIDINKIQWKKSK